MSRHNRDRRKRRDHPKYAPALVAAGLAAMAAGVLKPGRVSHINVYHDDWCDLVAGRGPCNCNPVVGPAQVAPTPDA